MTDEKTTVAKERRASTGFKIVTSANGKMADILKISYRRNRSVGYHVTVFDINGELGFGTRFDHEHAFSSQHERKRGKFSFKPEVISQSLHIHRQFTTYMDADAFAIRRFDEVDSNDYDVGVTMRRKEERGASPWPYVYGFINTGVLFLNYSSAAFKFLRLWESEILKTKSQSDQEALNRMVLKASDLTEYDKVFQWNGINIKVFRCDDYNFYYWPQEPFSTTKILHAKTDRRAALCDWGQRNWLE